MDAIGIEGDKGRFRGVFATKLQSGFPIFVPHNELAAGRKRRQNEHERGEHPACLLGIAMTHEEAALIIDQELVKLGRDRVAHPEPLADTGEN